MLDWLYWLAAVLAIAGIRRDNWTAVPLLGSVAFCFLARRYDWPFNLWLWLAVDVAVLVAVAWPLFPIIRARAWIWLLAFRRELAVLALFVPAFIAYALPPASAHVLSTAVATAQLLVTVPYSRLARQWLATTRRINDWARFDLMRVSAA